MTRKNNTTGTVAAIVTPQMSAEIWAKVITPVKTPNGPVAPMDLTVPEMNDDVALAIVRNAGRCSAESIANAVAAYVAFFSGELWDRAGCTLDQFIAQLAERSGTADMVHQAKREAIVGAVLSLPNGNHKPSAKRLAALLGCNEKTVDRAYTAYKIANGDKDTPEPKSDAEKRAARVKRLAKADWSELLDGLRVRFAESPVAIEFVTQFNAALASIPELTDDTADDETSDDTATDDAPVTPPVPATPVKVKNARRVAAGQKAAATRAAKQAAAELAGAMTDDAIADALAMANA